MPSNPTIIISVIYNDNSDANGKHFGGSNFFKINLSVQNIFTWNDICLSLAKSKRINHPCQFLYTSCVRLQAVMYESSSSALDNAKISGSPAWFTRSKARGLRWESPPGCDKEMCHGILSIGQMVHLLVFHHLPFHSSHFLCLYFVQAS